MSLQIEGKIAQIYPTNQVSDKFKKRDIVIAIEDNVNGNVYTNYAVFQLQQAKCEIIDRFRVGDVVKVSFSFKGTRYEKDGKVNYYNSLVAWQVSQLHSGGQNPAPPQHQHPQQTQQNWAQPPAQPQMRYTPPNNFQPGVPNTAPVDDVPF